MLLETPRDVDESLENAERSLVDGKWRKAERICGEILKQGQHPKAAHLLGKVYLASGQPKKALERFRQVVNWEPENAAAHFACAALFWGEGDAEEAAGSWIAGLEIDPAHVTAHLGLSDALLRLGLNEAASIAARQALMVEPENVDAWERLARAAELGDNRLEAIHALRKCVGLRPESTEYLRRLAILHQAAGDLEQSSSLLERAVQLEPRSAGLRFDYGQILVKQSARVAGLQQLREAVRLQPRFPEALSNMGMLLRAERQFQEAEATYKRACSQNPDFAPAWNNLANLYVELGRLDQAERCYSKAIVISPDYAEAHTGRAMLRLLEGRFAEGWIEYEWRWSQPGHRRRKFPQPEWDGSDLRNRTILLHAEQGAGDTIQFVRYTKLLKQLGARRVVLYCPTSLRTVIETNPDIDQVFCGQEAAPAFDVHAPLMSLPRLFDTDLSNLPGATPYLSVPPETSVPEALIKTDALRVGLAWSGNPSHHNDRNRSIPAAVLEPLLGLDGIRFFSLQLGGEPLGERRGSHSVVDLGPFLSTYSVTAGCLRSLDLLITVDTSVAHLAGALGRPVWMMIPTCNDWRWLLNRADTPWYPSMRIFRQTSLGNWSDVVEQIRGECLALTTGERV